MRISTAALVATVGLVSASPARRSAEASDATALAERKIALASAYAPIKVDCPDKSLNRPATSLGEREAAYISAREENAKVALASWIESTGDFDTSNVPTLAFAASGGGYRALLCAAGVVQAFDSRDSSSSTAGIFQGLSYFSALSGGGWLLSSIAGNHWPTISNLRDTLWSTAFEESPLNYAGATFPVDDAVIIRDLDAKYDAGFPITLNDAWGRFLSYTLLKGADGGVRKRLGRLAHSANFSAAEVPYPIWTSLGIEKGNYVIPKNATQYELTPYEFGSWDAGVKAFTKTHFLGTSQSNGEPTSSECVAHYDNLGFVLGTSSDIFGEYPAALFPASNASIPGIFIAAVDAVEGDVAVDFGSEYPNPFYQSDASPLVSASETLYLVDGGIGGQNDPIWPFLQPERSVDVLIVSDNSADTSGNLPNGAEIYNTYQRALQAGLTKMPEIPDNATFLALGLNNHSTIFGCDNPDQLTIVWLPNVPYSYNSGVPTSQLVYNSSETAAVIANGNLIATQNGTADWPTCLACVMQKKTGTELPYECTACFEKYCWSSSYSSSSY